MLEKRPIKVELNLRGYWTPEGKFCDKIGSNPEWTWKTLLLEPLQKKFEDIELNLVEETPNKVHLRVTFKNRKATPNAVYSIMNRYLEINNKRLAPSGLSVSREMPAMAVQ